MRFPFKQRKTLNKFAFLAKGSICSIKVVDFKYTKIKLMYHYSGEELILETRIGSSKLLVPNCNKSSYEVLPKEVFNIPFSLKLSLSENSKKKVNTINVIAFLYSTFIRNK